jgi:hypothetical protein
MKNNPARKLCDKFTTTTEDINDILSLEEKKQILKKVNDVLGQIPGHVISMDFRELEYNMIYKTEEGFYFRVILERCEHEDSFIGKTLEDAVKTIALQWINTYAYSNAAYLYPEEKELSQIDKINKFKSYCECYL